MKQTGTTLLEMLIVLAIAAILLTVALPGMGSLVDSGEVSASTNEMLASLHLARSEAIKRGGRTVMCPSGDGGSCSDVEWHEGWLLFHDANNNAQLDGSEEVIQVRQPLPDGIRLTGSSPVSSYVSYAPTGSTKMVSGAWQAGTFTVCKADATVKARRVIISSTGRPRTVKLSLDTCP